MPRSGRGPVLPDLRGGGAGMAQHPRDGGTGMASHPTWSHRGAAGRQAGLMATRYGIVIVMAGVLICVVSCTDGKLSVTKHWIQMFKKVEILFPIYTPLEDS